MVEEDIGRREVNTFLPFVAESSYDLRCEYSILFYIYTKIKNFKKSNKTHLRLMERDLRLMGIQFLKQERTNAKVKTKKESVMNEDRQRVRVQ